MCIIYIYIYIYIYIKLPYIIDIRRGKAFFLCRLDSFRCSALGWEVEEIPSAIVDGLLEWCRTG